MTDVPADLLERLRKHRQGHVLAGWHALAPERRRAFVAQLARIDFEELAALVAQSHAVAAPPQADRIAPLPVAPAEASVAERAIGEEALRRGEVAALIVAGGQGSRLGFDKPKG